MLHAIGILDLRIEVSNPFKRPLLHPLTVVAYVLGEATRARPVVLREFVPLCRGVHGRLRPAVIIPFKKTKEDAVAALKKFYQGRWLLPDAFKDANRIKEIQSMYVPFWLFDADVNASATFRAETDYVTETSAETITETRIYACHRSGTMSFHAAPADGSHRIDDNYTESIESFDFSALIPFSPAYLAGHLADKYDVDAKASAPRIDRRVCTSAVSILADTVKGYHRRSLDGNAQIAKRDGA